MFSLCFQTTRAQMHSDRGTQAYLVAASRAKGSTVTRVREPSETKPLRQMTSTQAAQEKSRGLEKSLMGVVGLETAVPGLYTGLVKTGIMSLEMRVQRMSAAPRARFALPRGEDYSIWDLEASYPIDPAEFQTMGRATPFAGETVFGRCKATVVEGRLVWLDRKGE